MGASESKPSPGASLHQWTGTSPASVSRELAESFQTSSETDASRAQLTELQVQARVAEELTKLRAKEAEILKQALSAEDDSSTSPADQINSQSVSKELDALRTKLEERRQVRDVPEGVKNARGEVVKCLREHDRRPLNCWQEVETFKQEVRKWEKGWVEKVVS